MDRMARQVDKPSFRRSNIVLRRSFLYARHMFLPGLNRFIYKWLLKPVFFLMDPEKIHNRIITFGWLLGTNPVKRGLTSFFFKYENPMLETEVLGIGFKNPIGLSAGFDKDAKLLKIIPAVGFGFEEIGSLTAMPSKGNRGKRLWRLPKSRGLVVNYGLNNKGAEAVCEKLKEKKYAFPVGISIAKTNCKEMAEDEEGIKDYANGLKACLDVGDYYAINVSCPNAYGGQPFHRPDALDDLFHTLDKIKTEKPIFVKLSVDTATEVLDKIIEVAEKHRIHGFIFSNLTKQYDRPTIDREELKKQKITIGGVSGKPIEGATNELISYMYKKTKGKYVIIGSGGVFSAEDAYEKIKCGASLIQLITGMIYEGPQLIGEINKGLVALLKKDGYSNVSEAIGAYNK